MANPNPTSGWFEPPGVERPAYPSHIHYVHLPPPLDPTKPIKLASFGLHHNLVRPSSGQRFANLLDPTDWVWHQGEHTKNVLRGLHHAGWTLVVFGNELGVSWDTGMKIPMVRLKIEAIAQSLGLPIRFMLALKRDSCRLPDTEMFDGLEFFYERNSVKIDHQNSFFCGNAAGRPGDYADSDLQLAANNGIHFVTPEQCFSPNFLQLQLPTILAIPLANQPNLVPDDGYLQRMPRNPDESDSSSESVVVDQPPPPLFPSPSTSRAHQRPISISSDESKPLASLASSFSKGKGKANAKKARGRRPSTSSSSTASSSSSDSSSSDSESTASSSESSDAARRKRKGKGKQPVVRKKKKTSAKGKGKEIVDLDSDEPLSSQRTKK
ncbi:polynucleotide kinase 3 phosphatase-domain-containing protein [Mrakia frigida]|uniref:polynucleotide kinase 3 phosphatase-domain-containing protein n=1 Tax=Mrakia frigida TaxID=29902 RepID=UPI003FCC0AF3